MLHVNRHTTLHDHQADMIVSIGGSCGSFILIFTVAEYSASMLHYTPIVA